ncbi:MAG: sigma-70 family RNA polymerase sigma factor [Acidobacteria bacterium]|nr:sigma-70 family RNA polymerase sigma factor [Acidobacteriota bacterium]
MDERLETKLLEEAKAGSAEAFEQAITPHLPMLFAYSRAICADHHAAHDVVQEVALIAHQNLTHLFPQTDFGAWLKAIARRQALSMRRRLTRAPILAEASLEAVYLDPTPDATAPRRDALAGCLRQMEGRLGRILHEHYFVGLKVPDIAHAMNMKRHAIAQLLYRGRVLLRECIQKKLTEEAAS